MTAVRLVSVRWDASWNKSGCVRTSCKPMPLPRPRPAPTSTELTMTENIIAILPEFWLSIGQTFMMLGIGLACAIVFGGPLGVLLFQMGPGQTRANRPVYLVVSWIVNTVRSFPFIILLVVLTPVTAALVGTSIGPLAASVPLAAAAIP